MSFIFSEEDDKNRTMSNFADQVKRITTVEPKSEEMRSHLIKWLNNLYMKMPTQCTVETMKRLVILTPVYKEGLYKL